MTPIIKAQTVQMSDVSYELSHFILAACKTALRTRIEKDLKDDYMAVQSANYREELRFIWSLHRIFDEISEASDFEKSIEILISSYIHK